MKWTKEKRRVCNTCHIDAVSTVLYIGFIVTYEKRNDISQKKKVFRGFYTSLTDREHKSQRFATVHPKDLAASIRGSLRHE